MSGKYGIVLSTGTPRVLDYIFSGWNHSLYRTAKLVEGVKEDADIHET